MQLKLRNIAKAKEATIDIEGITVVAGENIILLLIQNWST